MAIHGRKGSILGVGIGPVAVDVADLDAKDVVMSVDGRAAGATANFLKFIEASPVGGYIDHFTEDMTASGSGELRLKLTLPLERIEATRVDGRYRFIANQVVPDPDMPPLTDVNGEIHFTGERLEGQKIRAAMLGMPLTLDIAPAGDGNVAIKTSGNLSVRSLAQQFDHPVLGHFSGTAPWSGTVKVRKKTAELRLESSLQGIASSLPEPFNKAANDVMPLVIERKQGPVPGRDLTSLSLGDALKMQLVRRHEGGKTTIERGVVAVGVAPRLPERGVALAMQGKRLDIDYWRRLLAGDGKGDAALPLSQVDLRCDELVFSGHSIAGLRLAATRSGGLWRADIKSRDASGNLEWDGQGAGRVSGHLAHLALHDVASAKAPSVDNPDEMPAVDLVVDRFSLQGKEMGALKLKAENAKDGYWNARFDMRNDDASLEGSGRWRPSETAADTRIEFKLAAKSVEKLLTRMGYPEAVKRGTASLEGALSWKGMPTAIDYPSLDGNLKFEAGGGQFNRLEPGVGRLLGVLSLQSLPRRLTLDFRDVFSEGFAFDSIAGQAVVSRGVMETKNLKIAGPAAKVLMAGSVNLVNETQNLMVRVQPEIGETVATGVLLAHP
ncbi:MAG: TIGR02099 family protein, partial [Rhodocyclales bacterium]|nr:TIGR02099 family protein [Rhodocyclales bacterium]